MISGCLAVVHQVAPELHGVYVMYRNGVAHLDNGTGIHFVRVGVPRAHPTMGSGVSLPAVGELGLVIGIDTEVAVWVCSLHWQAQNAADPDPGLSFIHHDSGVLQQVRSNGDMQLDHPSGVRLRITESNAPLAVPSNSTAPGLGGGPGAYLAIDHPSGLSIKVGPSGALEIAQVASVKVQCKGTIAIQADGNVSVEGKDVTVKGENVKLQAGEKRFAMEDLVTWVKDHQHLSVATGTGVSGKPTAPPPGSSLSPSSLTGP
jgi:hypothetical protein